METTKKRDWGLIIAGVLLIICSIVFMLAPVATLVTLTVFAGAAFLVAGVFGIISYVRFRKTSAVSGWTIFYAILDIILGIMFLINPLALAPTIPWVIGIFFVIFGIFEIIAAFRVRKAGVSLWGWTLTSGILGVLIGICFFFLPESLSIFLGAFLLLRGISLIIYGFSASRILV